jgi:hypothetical protein
MSEMVFEIDASSLQKSMKAINEAVDSLKAIEEQLDLEWRYV